VATRTAGPAAAAGLKRQARSHTPSADLGPASLDAAAADIIALLRRHETCEKPLSPDLAIKAETSSMHTVNKHIGALMPIPEFKMGVYGTGSTVKRDI